MAVTLTLLFHLEAKDGDIQIENMAVDWLFVIYGGMCAEVSSSKKQQ